MKESKLSSKINPVYKLEDVANSLIKYLKDKKVVMLGEASHGTSEYYTIRRLITEKLMKEHSFNFVAVEGDWPECYSINQYIKGKGRPEELAYNVLKSFKRWPNWMWSNTEILKLMENLKEINKDKEKKEKVSVYGLDVYSLFESIDRVIEELEKIDPKMAELARYRYGCFEKFHRDEKKYLQYLINFPKGCREGVIEMLKEILKLRLDGMDTEDEVFMNLKQNAKIVLNAETYYRTMILGDDDSWNVRDRHMVETLESIFKSLPPEAKGIIWAHNTHIGDYKFTSMVDQGEINIGGLVREKYGEENVALVGFGTHRGTVIASNKWGGKIKTLPVPPAIHGSYDEMFHNICTELKAPMCYVNFQELNDNNEEKKKFLDTKGQRAIGVVYHPAYERGNYVPTVIGRRYDSFIFIDETNALEPLILTKPNMKEIPHDFPANT